MGIHTDRKFAVVTGASSGIGFALARECLANGFDVMICSEDTGIHDAAAELGAIAKGRAVLPVQADLATFEGVESLANAVKAHPFPVDALLLNAGIGVSGAFTDTSLRDELESISLNCGHVVHLTKRLLPRMIARGQGRILITGSVLSTAPNPYLAVYAATKAFVMSFAEGLRVELEDTGVTVTVLQPGATDTNFFARAGMDDTAVAEGPKDDPALVASQGFAAMMAGKDSVLAGSFRHRVGGFLNELLPETLKAHVTAKSAKPGSAKG